MRNRTPQQSFFLLLSCGTIFLGVSGCSISGPSAEAVGSAVSDIVNSLRHDSGSLDGSEGGSGDTSSGRGASETSESGNTDVADVIVGDCVDDAHLGNDVVVPQAGADAASSGADAPPALVVTRLDVVDCGKPHDSEVYGFAHYTSAIIPSDDELDSIADEHCGHLFQSYVGVAVGDSRLDYTFYTPTVESWADGDSSALCELYLSSDVEGAQLTGSEKLSRH